MTPEELETWVLDQPLILAYIILLLGGSLVSFIILIVNLARPRRIERNPVSPWQIKTLDFSIFMVAVVLWFFLSGSALMQVYWWFAGEGTEASAEIMVIGGILLQTGLLYLFLRFRFHYRNPMEGPVSPRLLPLGKSIGLGLFYFLATLPLVYGVGAVWNGFLEFMRNQGYEVDLPLQDAVMLFKETDNPFTFFGLLVLAVVIAPIVEEAVFRAGIFRFFKGKTSLTLSLLISGTLFGMIHGNLQSLPGLITVGICLGIAYELSGSLKVPIFFHAFFNLNTVVLILILPDNLPT